MDREKLADVTEATKASVLIVALPGPLTRLTALQSLALDDIPVSRMVVLPDWGMKFVVGPLMKQDPLPAPETGVNTAAVQTSFLAALLINEH